MPSPVPLAELQQRVSDAGTSAPQLEPTSEMPWNMDYGSRYQQQAYQQMPSSWFSAAPQFNSIHPQYPNMQSTDTGSTSYGSFFPVHSSDYDLSQPTSEEFQQVYVAGGYRLAQLPTNTNDVAPFSPTMAAQVESPPDLKSSPPNQIMSYGPQSSCRSARSNNLDEDEVWTGAPVSKKRRRQFSDGEREQTKTIRKMGSCARCKYMKLRVSQASAPDIAVACIYVSLRFVNLSAIKATHAKGVWKTNQSSELILGHATEGICRSSHWSVKVSWPDLLLSHVC